MFPVAWRLLQRYRDLKFYLAESLAALTNGEIKARIAFYCRMWDRRAK